MNTQVEILLVEDNMSDAELTIRALNKKNLANKLVHLENGQQALDFVFARGNYSHRIIADTPKIILLDLKMPKMDGIQVLKEIKSDHRTQKIPVIVLTSSREDPDIQECYRLGANSYVVKPVEFDKFLNAVSELGLFWMLINQPPV
ncbi:MAG: response regulator [Bacteroidia bacterium]|nr:response regulator [Bacteroidia bacterium]